MCACEKKVARTTSKGGIIKNKNSRGLLFVHEKQETSHAGAQLSTCQRPPCLLYQVADMPFYLPPTIWPWRFRQVLKIKNPTSNYPVGRRGGCTNEPPEVWRRRHPRKVFEVAHGGGGKVRRVQGPRKKPSSGPKMRERGGGEGVVAERNNCSKHVPLRTDESR